MRILVISNLYPPYFIGGYELRCEDTVKYLQRKGHEVHVLTSTFGINGSEQEEKIYRLLHLEDLYLGIKRKYQVSRSLVTIWKDNSAVKKLLKRIKPDIIAVWNMEGVSPTVLITLQKSKIPMVYDVSDYWLVDYAKNRWFDVWTRHSVKIAKRLGKKLVASILQLFVPLYPKNLNLKHIYFTSNSVKETYLKEKFPIEHGGIIYCGIHLPQQSETAPRVHNGHLKLLFSGRIEKAKGVHTVINALDILVNSKKLTNISLSIVGPQQNFEYSSYLKGIITAKNLDEYVQFTGKVERYAMPQVYKSHDILIFPSIWAEPFALTILEGMSYGMPVISTTTGGSKEILVDEKNSLTFPADDAAALAGQIEKLIGNPDLKDKVAACGKKLVYERFGIEYMAVQIENYLQKALKNSA